MIPMRMMKLLSVATTAAWLAGLLALPLAALATAAAADQTGQQRQPTADHAKFEELQQEFETGPAVTKACLGCHTEAAKQLHATSHWTWEVVNPQGQKLGKRNVVNNFCIAVSTNEPRCTSCHIGYGWKDDSFDFTSEENVDCLVCHDSTGQYRKFPAGAGHPPYKEVEFPPGSGKVWKPLNLTEIAQNVGRTSRQTCGRCHFSGGGGEAVKHGDLDSTLIKADRELDVHMDAGGLNFACSTCHRPTNHNIPGSRYVMQAKDTKGIDIPGRDDQNRASCESCHGLTPHGLDLQLNGHVHKVACQTCHIPTIARREATKVYWDWSTAGKKNPEGKNFKKKDDQGNVVYDTMKGDFKWQKDFAPEYVWFNGQIDYTELTTKLDDSQTVLINAFRGDYKDPKARIWPVKRFVGVQPYDEVNKTLVTPHLFGKDPAAYWKSYDWDKAIEVGMAAKGVPYSGEYGFIKTEMLWPQTHMVAPAEKALACEACHTAGGRLAHLMGFYIPGRDRSGLLDTLGLALLVLSVLGVVVHALRKKG